MPHDHSPPAEADDRKAPAAEAKRTWSKPVVRRMSYVDVTSDGGPDAHAINVEPGPSYRPYS